ncbi:MAG: hypothetical protein WC898_02460 [Candidatus Paceibacterota bacterium]|jgi:hypothetical protein
MAKTTIAFGGIVPSAYLNANASHVHDGVDEDGHNSQISLDAHVDGVAIAQITGRIPYCNLPVLRLYGYRSGLKMSYYEDGGDWGIDIAIGVAESQNSVSIGGVSSTPLIEVGTTIRKKVINSGNWSTWVEGTAGSGGIPIAATEWTQAIDDDIWLHCFLLGKSTDLTAFDFGFDDSIIAVQLREVAASAGYDLYRRIGSINILYDSTYQIRAFKNYGKKFLWENNVNGYVRNLSSQTLSSYQGLTSANVPPDVSVEALLRCLVDTRTVAMCMCNVLITDYDQSDDNFTEQSSILSYENIICGEFKVITDIYKQFKLSYISSADIDTLLISNLGWIEL